MVKDKSKQQPIQNLIEAATESLDVLLKIDEEIDGPMAMPSPLTVRLAATLEAIKGQVYTCAGCGREIVGEVGTQFNVRCYQRQGSRYRTAVRVDKYCPGLCADRAEDSYNEWRSMEEDRARDDEGGSDE